jgi:phosphopantetheinyl transferase/acyl carrier protein
MKPIYVPQTDGWAGPDPVSSLPIMEYFRTMEHFLNVQQEVMQEFLSCGAAPGPKSSWPGPLTQELSQPPAENRPHSPHDFPLSALTGTEQPMLVVERPAATAGTPVQPQDVFARFLALVSEKTGYPLEMLDLSLNMEADLGIDSIKRVEIFATFQHDTGLIQPEDMEQAVGLKTLQEVITYLTERAQAGPTAMAVGPEPILSEHSRYAPSGRSSSAKESAGPFVRELLSLRVGEEAVVACTLDLRHDQFLRDHTAIGRRISILDSGLVGMPVVPLTVSLEIMAEVAALLLPGKQLIGIKNVQALSWFALEEDRCAIVIHARSQRSDPGDAVAVQLVKASEQTTGSHGKGQPIMQGIVVFGDRYPTSPELGDFTRREGRSYRCSSDRYYEEVMFHGPLFQGVATIDECGEDGIEGTLRSGMETGFFRSQTSADFLLDPVLLDAAGQLVGFWTADRLERGFVFPVGFTALHLYGPLRTTTNPVVCRVRILSVNEGRVRADIDCIDATGRMLAQLVGWEDVWFDFPQEFTRFNLSPHDTILSESWPEAVEQLSHMTALHCCRLGRDALPEALFDTTSPMWQLIWARLILNRNEYEKWRLLRGSERRRTEWLLGRLVGKDAVRQLLITRYSLQLCPADIEIDSDHHGALVVRGPWTAITGRAPCLTLAHSDGIAVAIAAECQLDEGIGIDIERVRELPNELMTATFSPEEYGLIAHLEPALAREWAVRLWCAKEALGKALGVGLLGGPLNAPVQEVDIQTGGVRITLTGQLSRELALPSDTAFTVYTHCDGDIAVASTLALRSGATYADESNLSTMGCGARRGLNET